MGGTEPTPGLTASLSGGVLGVSPVTSPEDELRGRPGAADANLTT
jgi:hypothetical protein